MASNPARQVQEEFLSAIGKSQEAVLEAVKTWVETVQSMVPQVPAAQIPPAGQLPRPEELVASAYDFAEQLLASQRRFAEEVLNATSPLLPGR